MDLLHRLGQSLAAKFSEQKTVQRLKRLDDRNLADLGISREEIRPVARLAARVGPEGIPLTEIIARVRAGGGTRSGPTAWLHGTLALAAERVSANESHTLAYTPSDLDRYMEQAHRLRAETIAGLWQSLRRQFAETQLGRRLTLDRLRRGEFARITRELESYTPQQLMGDLRLTPSEIDGIATDGAARAVDAFVRAHPDYRGAAGWEGRRTGTSHAHG